MKELPEQYNECCPYCGYARRSYNCPKAWLKPGSYLNNRYYIGRAVGSDLCGLSYNAFDVVMKRRVVIRQLLLQNMIPADAAQIFDDSIFYNDPQAERFFYTYRQLADIEVSSLPKIYTYNRCGSVIYAVTKQVPELTLSTYIRNAGAKNFEGAKKLLLPLIIALKLMHDKGIFHGCLNMASVRKTDSGLILFDIPGASCIEESAAFNPAEAGTNPFVSDLKNFLLIFISVLYGVDKNVDPQIINRDMLSRSEPAMPEDVKAYIYSAFNGGNEMELTARGILDVIFKCGEIAVGQKKQVPNNPPQYLLESARESGVCVTKLITSLR